MQAAKTKLFQQCTIAVSVVVGSCLSEHRTAPLSSLISGRQHQLLPSRTCTTIIPWRLSTEDWQGRISISYVSTFWSAVLTRDSGVPGEVRGLEYLHRKYGSLPWATLMQPAIRTARNGFPVSLDLVKYMELAVGDGEDFLSKDPNWALDFAPNGTRLGLGDTITRRRYADTLDTIAERGPDAFYTGAMAETMINAVKAANGTMTLEDLKNYTVAIRNTSQIDYRGYTITSTTAPSSGIVALSILKILSTYKGLFDSEKSVNLSTHRMDEAMRFGYGEVRVLGLQRFFSSC